MNPSRFDTLTCSLTDARSRRGALTTLLAGTLGLLGLTETAARKKNGKGKKHRGKRKKKGENPSSPPPAPPPAPPPPNECAGQPDFAPCGNGMACSGGVCGTNPDCWVGPCPPANVRCCNGGEICFIGTATCPESNPGQPCDEFSDCAGNGRCVGFICQ